jgi:hypothetical protein
VGFCFGPLAIINEDSSTMKLKDFLARAGNRHKEEGNPHVTCNALYKKANNFNCLLTPSQAIQHAQQLLQKAQLILDEGIEDAAVHVWCVGPTSERLNCGLNQARKGGRRKKKLASV